MKFSEQWLREWVNPDVDTAGLAEQLTMVGLEVDTVVPAAPIFTGVVVGHVLERVQHPNADRLSCCQVDVGAENPLRIVCGAKNVRAGLKVAVATVGAVLPGDFKIKKSKLRGELSEGMICAAGELGLAEESDGIMELREDAPIGVDFREYRALEDQLIDIELTPNRGDCLSIRGLAREVGVINRVPVQAPELSVIAAQHEDVIAINLQAPDRCPRYAGRSIKNINCRAASPLWLQERLRRSGIRSIHPVVDVCNYVMLELGQPMHAFDLAQVQGDITIRAAVAGEKLKLLDQTELTLAADSLVIADQDKPLALAGIMGGLDSGVVEDTATIFLESAFFAPIPLRADARRYSLQTDSSYRFERGVDTQLQVQAIERATAILLDIVGGEPGPTILQESTAELPKYPEIMLRPPQIKRILGVDMDREVVEDTLQRLDMTVRPDGENLHVTVPSFRFDLAREVDLIEELARIYGYDKIPAVQMVAPAVIAAKPECELPAQAIVRTLIERGFWQVINYSFIDPALAQQFNPELPLALLANPLSQELSAMRASLWPGLIHSMLYNLNRQQHRVRFFEMGLCFSLVEGRWVQTPKLAFCAVGDVYPEQWSTTPRPVDFFDLKGDFAALMQLMGQEDTFSWKKTTHSALHPGQSAEIWQNDRIVGYLGMMHPKLVQELSLSQAPVMGEIDLSAMSHYRVPSYRAVSKYPAVRRDIALEVDQDVAVAQIIAIIQDTATQLLQRVQLFDLYEGESISKGKKSVALGLTFQDPSRTLVDDEINHVIQDLVEVLNNKIGAKLRA